MKANLKEIVSSSFCRANHPASIAEIAGFLEKIDVVYRSGRYQKLIKGFSVVNDKSNLMSMVFEVVLAYRFEMAGVPVDYEINVRDSDNSSIDFHFLVDDGSSVFMEAKLIQDIKYRDSIESQLKKLNNYKILMSHEEQVRQILRLQSDILSKLQNKNGDPIKFNLPSDKSMNCVVINVSDLIVDMFDKLDAMLVVFGDKGVPEYLKLGVVGIFDPQIRDELKQDLFDKFSYAQRVLNGIIFISKDKFSSEINYEPRFFFVSNPLITSGIKKTKILHALNKIFPECM